MAEKRITRADVHRLAEQLMGSRRDAQAWLTTPSMALEQRRPVDLMARDDEGLRTVHTLLTQLEYGVYV